MDRVLLRTLTPLSRFDGGKYENQKVETVIKIDPFYIRYEYFRMSKISFTDEVLTVVGITEKYRIEKPSTNEEMFHKLNLDMVKSMTEDEKILHFRKKKESRMKKAKIDKSTRTNSDNRLFSKESLKSINNGVFKFNFGIKNIK